MEHHSRRTILAHHPRTPSEAHHSAILGHRDGGATHPPSFARSCIILPCILAAVHLTRTQAHQQRCSVATSSLQFAFFLKRTYSPLSLLLFVLLLLFQLRCCSTLAPGANNDQQRPTTAAAAAHLALLPHTMHPRRFK